MSINISYKFKKELQSFFEWCIDNKYIISDIDEKEFNWSFDLPIKFEEPSRNKLEIYIQSILKKYTVVANNETIGDAKLFSKEFKNREKKEKKVKEVKEKKVKEVKEKKVKEVKEVKKVKEVKEKKVEEKNDEVIIKLDMSLDTSEIDNLDVLEYWTADLINVFGKPKKTGGKDDFHVYEWKFDINNEVYSIYDCDNKEEFKNITWYLGGSDKKYIKNLYEYINEHNSGSFKHKELTDKAVNATLEDEDSILITLSDIESDIESDNDM